MISIPEQPKILEAYHACMLCPRRCGVDRFVRTGVCGANDTLRVGRAALHWWEEPCLVGDRGSGAVFFAHCALGCVYCQNKRLAEGEGVEITQERLREILLGLRTSIWSRQAIMRQALRRCFVNCGHREHFISLLFGIRLAMKAPRWLALLEGLVDIYLVDFKYSNPTTAQRLSAASDLCGGSACGDRADDRANGSATFERRRVSGAWCDRAPSGVAWLCG